MSAELHDLRTKLTDRAHSVLDAVARASGRDRNEIVREVMDRWADERLHEAILVLRLAGDEGLARDAQGARAA